MPAVKTGMINVARHFCSYIGTVSQALMAAMSQAHRRHMRTRLKQNHHFYNLKQTRGSSGMTGPQSAVTLYLKLYFPS